MVPVARPELVVSGDGLVEDAVRFINATVTETVERGAKGLLKIGEYVFTRFFKGDPVLVQFRGRKDASFRALADHPNLQLSLGGLCTSVHLAMQERQLSAAGVQTSEHLMVSHRVELLRVADLAQKRSLIEAVRDEELSVRALHQRINELGTGRPRLLGNGGGARNGSWSVPKPIQALAKLDLARLIAPGKLDELEDSRREAYIEVLHEAELRIQKMIRALEAAK